MAFSMSSAKGMWLAEYFYTDVIIPDKNVTEKGEPTLENKENCKETGKIERESKRPLRE